jgi:outer membrane protein assembly factor BamB
MKSLHRTVLQAAAALCVVASGASFAIHADEAKQDAKPKVADELALDLQASAIPLTLEGAASDGTPFVLGHTDEAGWHATVARGNPRSPAVDNGIVVVGSGGGNQVYGYDAVSGKRKWTASSKDSGISDIVIGLGRAYYTTYSCTLESVRVTDGGQLYSKWLASTVDCAPDVKDEIVATAFHSSGKWKVSMRHSDSGNQKWASAIGDQGVLTAPMIMDSGVYLTTADGHLTRLNAAKGKKEWEADFGAVSAPVPTPWGLLVTTTWDERGDTKAGKVSEADRKRDRETVTGGDNVAGTLVAAKNRRVALIDNPSVKPEGKVGKQDAGPRSSLDFQGVRPGVTPKHVILAYAGRITAVDPVAQRADWSIKLAHDSYVFTKPVAHRGLVFVASTDGVVAAIEESTGALIWSYRFKGESFVAQPALDQDYLFLTTSKGKLIALPTGAGNVDAGAPKAVDDNAEGNAAAYWRVQELFRKVRDIVREIEAAKPIEPEQPKAEDGRPANNGPDGAAPEDEAVRPREDETEELSKGEFERREARKAERGRPNGREYEKKDYKR